MITLPIWLFVLIIAGTIMVSIVFTIICLFFIGMWQTRRDHYKEYEQRKRDSKK